MTIFHLITKYNFTNVTIGNYRQDYICLLHAEYSIIIAYRVNLNGCKICNIPVCMYIYI